MARQAQQDRQQVQLQLPGKPHPRRRLPHPRVEDIGRQVAQPEQRRARQQPNPGPVSAPNLSLDPPAKHGLFPRDSERDVDHQSEEDAQQ